MSFSKDTATRDLAEGDLEGLRERYPREWDRVSESSQAATCSGFPFES